MKTTFKKVTLSLLLMAAAVVFTFIGCKKTGMVRDELTPDELKSYEADIKAQIAKLPAIEKMPTQIFSEKIPVSTYLADENNNPLPAGTTPARTASPCNFTTPAYCNLIQYARTWDCSASSGSSDGGYYLQFTYELSWDNSIYTRTSVGYLKIYDAATNALVVNATATNFNVNVVDLGADIVNPGNNIYRVTFSCPTLVSTSIVNSGTAYSVYTSALFSTTCSNGTNYLVGSNAVTSAGFTGASGNDPCKRNDKVVCLLASNGAPSPTYAPSVATYVYGTTGACGYSNTFVIPDVVEVQYSLNGGQSFIVSGWTGSGYSYQNYLKYHNPITGGGGFTFTTAPTLTSGTYNLVFRYRNWKYGDPNRLLTVPMTLPSASASPADCSNVGSATYPDGGFTYYYYGNVIIP